MLSQSPWPGVLLAVATGALLPTLGVSAQEVAGAEDLTPSGIANLYRASVVQVLVEAGPGVTKQGTGFAVGANGAFATTLHVIDGASRVWIRTADGEKHDLESISAFDLVHDLVVLQAAVVDLAPLTPGDSGELEIGDPLVVIGNPLGFAGTVTDGLLSGRRTGKSPEDEAPFGQDLVGLPECELLQISAPVARGSSGAPVFDRTGRLVGIEVGGVSGGELDINFAIPVEGLSPLLGRNDGLDLESLQRRIDRKRRDEAYHHLENARFSLDLNEFETAELELRLALARYPRFVEALKMLSDILVLRGEVEAAEELLLEATAIAPDSPDVWEALGEMYLEHDRAGGRLKARECFRRVLDLEPEHAGATYGLGALSYRAGRVDEAIRLLEKAYYSDPELLKAGFSLAMAYIQRNRFVEAGEIFDELLWQDRDFAGAHFGLAVVSYLTGQAMEESAHWRAFFDLVENDPSAGRLLESALKFLREQRPHLLPSRYR